MMWNQYFFVIWISIFSLIIGQSKELASQNTYSKVNRFFNNVFDFIKDFHQDNQEIAREKSELFMKQIFDIESKLESTHVWLTVSSVVNVTGHKNKDNHDQLLVRVLEIHWRRKNLPSEGDYLALHRVDKLEPIQIYPLINIETGETFPRYYKTSIEFDYQNLTNLKQDNICLEYYLVYVNKNGQAEAHNCIRMQSRWMEQEMEFIKDKRLFELMLPGTHDTSSYEKYDYDNYENNLLKRFQYTQDESLYNQLAYGIRYMDWRVGVYNHTLKTSNGETKKIEEFWMVHDISRNRITLKQAIGQVKRFLEQTTSEIIIIDFHRFVHGFDKVKDIQAIRRRLDTFVKLLEDHFGPFLIPYSNRGLPTVSELVTSGKRVLVGYSYKFDVRQFPDSRLFWPAVQHLWANTDKLASLEKYIADNICLSGKTYHNVHQLRSVMAELTPTFEGIFFRRYHGLRELAALVNMHFEQWFRYKWWNCTNIVSADFFLGTDIVQISIDVNRKRKLVDGKQNKR